MIHRRSRPRVPNGLTFRTSATEHVPIEDTARNLKQSEGSEASPESRVERRFIAQSGRSSGDADMSM